MNLRRRNTRRGHNLAGKCQPALGNPRPNFPVDRIDLALGQAGATRWGEPQWHGVKHIQAWSIVCASASTAFGMTEEDMEENKVALVRVGHL
jgi:hypothetical protein